jgi:hypothetical protein
MLFKFKHKFLKSFFESETSSAAEGQWLEEQRNIENLRMPLVGI